jgi:O-antigen/teichoic acid export membrane protein
MNLPPALKVSTMVGILVGVALAVAAGIGGSYLLAAIGAACALRLLAYYVRGRRARNVLPNESQLSRLRQRWRARRGL